MTVAPFQFGDFDIPGFLHGHWQKKPLLIRNPWRCWDNPLDPDELAGLACEDGVESRLVRRLDKGWMLDAGPFAEKRFTHPPREPWTLLVQSVDHHVPAVAALLEPFRFIPNWRVDDVMVSYAADGGGVGPHYDRYDVFLVQGLGRRRWQLGGLCDESTPLLAHDQLRLLASFDAQEEWILEPGDILYVPPGVAHNGIAVGEDCMTYSIGFRAPSRGELIENWSATVLDALYDDDRFTDPDLVEQDNPGEISPAAIDRLYAMMAERMLDRASFARWFGAYTTSPASDIEWQPDETITIDGVRAMMAAGAALIRNPACRFSFIRDGQSSVSLFVDGRCFPCTGHDAHFAERLCRDTRLAGPSDWADADGALIAELVNQGSIAFD